MASEVSMAIFNRKSSATPTKGKSSDSKKTSFTDKALVPVLPASVLLTNQKRAQFVDDMAKYTRLPRKLFDELYRAAINQFAEYAQRLHAVKGEKYAVLGGALDLGLERARNSMEQYQRYLKDNNIYPESLSMQQELWNYVLFSASLFYDVGRIAEHYQLKMYDDARDEVGDWLPAQDNMKAQGAYYFAEKRMDSDTEYLPELTVLIAKRLLPAKGYQWISSQRASLETWLQLLASDMDDEEGTRSLFISLILWVNNRLFAGDAPGGGAPKLTKKYTLPMMDFNKPPAGASDAGKKPAVSGGESVSAESGPLTPAGLTSGEPSGQFPNLGGEFLQWLRAGIASGVLNMNTLASMIQVVREGMIFRGPQIYGEFLKAKGLSDQFTVAQVEKSFQQLALTEPGMQGQAEVKVQAGNDTKNLQDWTLIPNAQNVFKEVKLDTQPHYAMVAASRVAHNYQWYRQLEQQAQPKSSFQGK